MTYRLVEAGEFMARRNGSVNPAKFPDEEFELHSIPAFDAGQPEMLRGSEIGSSKQIVRPNDVMISKIVPHIRRSSVVGPAADKRQIASGEWIVFRSEDLFPHYLRHLLVSDEFNRKFMSTVSGVGGSLLRARPAEVAKIKILVPPFSEQRRIAAILDKADALRAKRREAIAKLDQLLQSVFLDMFGDPVSNPKGLRKVSITSVADISTGGTPSRTDPRFFGGDIPWIKTTEVVGEPIFDTEEKLTSAGLKAIRGKLHPSGSIIVAMYGQGKTRGRCGLLMMEATCNQACGVIHPSATYDSKFLFWQLRQGYERIRSLGRGGNQENLNLRILGSVEVLMPAIDKQRRFACVAEAIERQMYSMRRDVNAQKLLFSSLQDRAFAGTL